MDKDCQIKFNHLAKQAAVLSLGISLTALLFKQKKVHAIFGAVGLACIAIHVHQQHKLKGKKNG